MPQQAVFRQDYSHTIWRSEGGLAQAKASIEQTSMFIPFAPIGLKGLKGEQITRTDVAFEAIAFIPVGRVFSGLRGVGGELLEQIVRKTDNLAGHLTEKDIAGAIRDINGNPVINQATGQAWDHLKEVTDALGGLKNQIKKLNKGIEGGKFSGEALDKAKDLRSNLQKQADNIQGVLDRAKNKANQ